MADESTSLPIPKTIDPRLIPDPSKQNLYGLQSDSAESYADNTEKVLKALEDRYAQPNWFKVAAGFAKPQLGGFAASLGSAAGALGDWQEQQKAIAPTVAALQTNLGMQRAVLGQNKAQASQWESFLRNPPKDPDEALRKAYEIASLNTDSQIGKLAATWTPQKSTAAGTKSTMLNTDIAAQEAKLSNPFLQVSPGFLPEDWANKHDVTRQALENNLIKSGNFTKDQLQGMSDNALLDTHLGMQKELAGKRMKNADNADAVIGDNTNALTDLSVARTIASGKSMNQLLGVSNGVGAVSALFGYIAAPADKDASSRLIDAARKLQDNNPELWGDFQVLQKVLTKNLADARSSIQNPSVGAQNLLSGSLPSVANTQPALIKMLDLIALEKSSSLKEAMLRQNYQGDPLRFAGSDEYRNLLNEKQQHSLGVSLANSSDLKRLPSFYNIRDIMNPRPDLPNPVHKTYGVPETPPPSIAAAAATTTNKPKPARKLSTADLMEIAGVK